MPRRAADNTRTPSESPQKKRRASTRGRKKQQGLQPVKCIRDFMTENNILIAFEVVFAAALLYILYLSTDLYQSL